MFKNTANQKWRVFAFDTRTNLPVEGIENSITATLVKNYGLPQSTIDEHPIEDVNGGGYYWFDLSQNETNANQIALLPVSDLNASTIVLIDPPSYYPV